jgi:peroxiredoxin family protein
VLFFTNGALLALAGNEGWHRLSGDAERQEKQRLTAGVAGLPELLDACAAMGARIFACEMGLRTMGLQANDLRNDLTIEVAGLVSFYNALPEGAQPSVL